MNKKFTYTKAFTLIELLIVVSIIAIFATTIIFALNKAKVRAVDSEILAEVNSLRQAMETYYLDHNQYPVVNTTSASGLIGYCTPFYNPSYNQGQSYLSLKELLESYIPLQGTETKKCIWISTKYPVGYTSYCGLTKPYAQGQGYTILYNLQTKKQEPWYYITYPASYGLYEGNFHCRTHLN
jgi:prepilin-type N-terminal cleavage/methylation domain-containing protein